MILAVVITYYPDLTLLRQNISAFQDDVDAILLWENTPQENAIRYRCFAEGGKIRYAGEVKNKGIAYALNYAWHYAEDHGYEYLLTMDQDTVWHGFHDFVRETALNDHASRGIWGPMMQPTMADKLFQPTNFIITSGMLIDVKLIRQIGGYPDYFVDGIDTELCCRALTQGIPIYTVAAGYIDQRCGTPERIHFLGRVFEVYDYPPQRLYGIYRNHFITFRKYPKATVLRHEWMKEWMKYRLAFTLMEKDRFSKLWAICRGIVAGLTHQIK